MMTTYRFHWIPMCLSGSNLGAKIWIFTVWLSPSCSNFHCYCHMTQMEPSYWLRELQNEAGHQVKSSRFFFKLKNADLRSFQNDYDVPYTAEYLGSNITYLMLKYWVNITGNFSKKSALTSPWKFTHFFHTTSLDLGVGGMDAITLWPLSMSLLLVTTIKMFGLIAIWEQ